MSTIYSIRWDFVFENNRKDEEFGKFWMESLRDPAGRRGNQGGQFTDSFSVDLQHLLSQDRPNNSTGSIISKQLQARPLGVRVGRDVEVDNVFWRNDGQCLKKFEQRKQEMNYRLLLLG